MDCPGGPEVACGLFLPWVPFSPQGEMLCTRPAAFVAWSVHSFIHFLYIWQIFIECILYAWLCASTGDTP